MANLSSLAIENESPDLNKLMELRFVQQDIDIIKNYILQGEGEEEGLIGFTDLSQIENCIKSIGDDKDRSAALDAIWCDPLYPNDNTLCLNTSIKKPEGFVARTIQDVKDLSGGKKTIRKKIIKNRKTIKFFNKIINKKTIKNKNKKHLKTFKNL